MTISRCFFSRSYPLSPPPPQSRQPYYPHDQATYFLSTERPAIEQLTSEGREMTTLFLFSYKFHFSQRKNRNQGSQKKRVSLAN